LKQNSKQRQYHKAIIKMFGKGLMTLGKGLDLFLKVKATLVH